MRFPVLRQFESPGREPLLRENHFARVKALLEEPAIFAEDRRFYFGREILGIRPVYRRILVRKREKGAAVRRERTMQILLEGLEAQHAHVRGHPAVDLEPSFDAPRERTVIRRVRGEGREIAGAREPVGRRMRDAWHTQMAGSQIVEPRYFEVVRISDNGEDHVEIAKVSSEPCKHLGRLDEIFVARSVHSPQARPEPDGNRVPHPAEREPELRAERRSGGRERTRRFGEDDPSPKTAEQEARDRRARRFRYMKKKDPVVKKHAPHTNSNAEGMMA